MQNYSILYLRIVRQEEILMSKNNKLKSTDPLCMLPFGKYNESFELLKMGEYSCLKKPSFRQYGNRYSGAETAIDWLDYNS